MKKTVLLMLSVVLILLSLVSCDTSGGADNAPPATDDTQGAESDNTGTVSGTVYSKIIYDDRAELYSDLRIAMTEMVGPWVTVTRYSDVPQSDGEIVFGYTDRDVTRAAEAELESLIARSGEYDSGYVIYCDGKSVGIYWSHADMAEIAVAAFTSICEGASELAFERGVAYSRLYSIAEFVENKYWIALEEQADEDVVQAIKKIYPYYGDPRIVEWLANLYDPEVGGFYYSISARDNEPFRPDLESTYQVISILKTGGAIKSESELPEELRRSIVAFAKSMQSPTDGYFYHPQWPQGKENLNTDRYGRDQGWAANLIKNIDLDTDGDGVLEDQFPTYCMSNGTKCEAHYGTKETCSFPVTGAASYYDTRIDGFTTATLVSSVGSAVSRVQSSYVKAVVSSRPDYSSREAFRAWLYEYNASIKENSGKAHNLSALASEIKARGYADIVCEMIATAQRETYDEQVSEGIEPTGLWQRNVDYNAVWGILKYANYYNSDSWQTPMDMKYILAMVKTCIKVIELPADGDYQANDIFNMWNSIDRILGHIDRHYGNAERQQVYELVRENAPSLIDNTILKLSDFKRDDGSFSLKSTGRTVSKIYGVPISLGNIEGDVNATSCIMNMYSGIYRALGYKKVPAFTASDARTFCETVTTCEPIVKVEDDAGPVDFESENTPIGFTSSIQNAGAYGEIVTDPEDGTNKVYHFVSPKTTSNSDSVNVATHTLGSNCYIVDFDLYVSSSGTDDGYVLQIFLSDSYIIAIHKKGNVITIKDDKYGNGAAATSKTWCTRSTDEWFRITCEVYVPGEDINELESPKIKFWVDEQYLGISEFFCDKDGDGVMAQNYLKAKFYSLKSKNMDIYIDNIYAASDDKTFDELYEWFDDVR